MLLYRSDHSIQRKGSVPGKQAFIESLKIHLWTRHDPSIKVDIIKPVVSVPKQKKTRISNQSIVLIIQTITTCTTSVWSLRQLWGQSSHCPHLAEPEKHELQDERRVRTDGLPQPSAHSCRPDRAAAEHRRSGGAHTGPGLFHFTHKHTHTHVIHVML